jgi:hypothetical protein
VSCADRLFRYSRDGSMFSPEGFQRTRGSCSTSASWLEFFAAVQTACMTGRLVAVSLQKLLSEFEIYGNRSQRNLRRFSVLIQLASSGTRWA